MAYTQAQNRATQKYTKNNYDDIKIRVPKGKREEYKELADKNGMSMNQLVIMLLDELKEKMNK